RTGGCGIGSFADDIEFDPHALACLGYRGGVSPFGSVVTEDGGPYWLGRQWGARCEPGKIHRVEDDVDVLRRNSGVLFETLPAAVPHCNVSKHARKDERLVMPRSCVVADKNGGSLAEAQQGSQGLGMMMSVNDVWN